MIPQALRYFFDTCTDTALLCKIQQWACANAVHAYQIAAMNQLIALGYSPRPKPRLVWSQDDAQRDYEDEADAHGVTVLTLIQGR
jgi:hypothetical protein